MPSQDAAKRSKEAAGTMAAERVRSGMILGLGTGSTVAFFLDALGRRIAGGEVEAVLGVPTSDHTEARARELGIPLTTLAEAGSLDLTVDGADEVDPDLNLIKGMGGALVREKMVAQATREFLVIVDERKLVGQLGTRSPLPVEVVRFGWESHEPFLRDLGADPRIRIGDDGTHFQTDNGNFILDCSFAGGIPDPMEMEMTLRSRAGVVGTGLFLGMARGVLVGGADGVTELTREDQGASGQA